MNLESRMILEMRMNFDTVCKKSLPADVNTLEGNDRTDSIFIYQTRIFCNKNGSKRSLLSEIGAQTFCYTLYIWSRHRLLCFTTSTKRNKAWLSARAEQHQCGQYLGFPSHRFFAFSPRTLRISAEQDTWKILNSKPRNQLYKSSVVTNLTSKRQDHFLQHCQQGFRRFSDP